MRATQIYAQGVGAVRPRCEDDPTRGLRCVCVGVFDGELGATYSELLGRLGRKRAWTVHGSAGAAGGMDELSTLGTTQVWETLERTQSHFSIDSSSLGLPAPELSELTGGDAAENASILTGILDGSITGAIRDLVTLNSAAGLVVTGKATDMSQGLDLAREQIDSGAGLAILHKWRDFH